MLQCMNLDPEASAIPLRKLFEALPESIRAYICYLENITQQQQENITQQKAQIQELEKQNLELQLQIHELKARLSKNSSNSGKPPSSDGLKRKPKSLRGKSDRKCGGQKGHVGKGLAQTSAPDEVVTHTPSNCSG